MSISNIVRRGLELAARNRSFKRRMPSPLTQAAIIVSPDAQLKYLKRGPEAFDLMLLNVATEFVRPGMNVWDVGANIGVFSVAAAALGANVIAIEADPWLAALLRKTARLRENRDLDLRVLGLAVANRDGLAELLIAARGRASNALEEAHGRSQMGGLRERCTVPTLRLDTIMETFGSPDFIKIDVEGAERMVLEGASNLLRRHRPAMLIEVGKEHAAYISEQLKVAGYRLYDASLPASERTAIERCAENTLAYPLSADGMDALTG